MYMLMLLMFLLMLLLFVNSVVINVAINVFNVVINVFNAGVHLDHSPSHQPSTLSDYDQTPPPDGSFVSFEPIQSTGPDFGAIAGIQSLSQCNSMYKQHFLSVNQMNKEKVWK